MGSLEKSLALALRSLFPDLDGLDALDVGCQQYGDLPVRTYRSHRSNFPVVVLHGLTRQGPDDRRFVRFCRMLAGAGLQVYAPRLCGLCELDTDEQDVLAAGDLVRCLAEEHRSQIGLAGVSFGGTYSLLASHMAEVASDVRFVLAIGPYVSLDELVADAFSRRHEARIPIDRLYGLLAIDWNYRSLLHITSEEMQRYESLMADTSCETGFTTEEHDLVRALAHDPGQEEIVRRWRQRLPLLRRLSFTDLPDLGTHSPPVFLLHAERDPLIPSDHSSRIESILRRQKTPVVRHVGPIGEHVGFSLRNDIGLARLFYQVMRLTEPSLHARSVDGVYDECVIG